MGDASSLFHRLASRTDCVLYIVQFQSDHEKNWQFDVPHRDFLNFEGGLFVKTLERDLIPDIEGMIHDQKLCVL